MYKLEGSTLHENLIIWDFLLLHVVVFYAKYMDDTSINYEEVTIRT